VFGECRFFVLLFGVRIWGREWLSCVGTCEKAGGFAWERFFWNGIICCSATRNGERVSDDERGKEFNDNSYINK